MKIYNTLSRKKEEFVPITPGKVLIYVCGPTVYNLIHIGNARPMVVFDTLRRYLIYKGYSVRYVQNFTDVDDKVINRAREEGKSAPEISGKYIKEYFEDAAALNVMKADVHPRVSGTIPDIVSFIQTLIDKGYAYEADGDVYFSTRRFPAYGRLSGQNIDDLESGARIAIGEVKEDPLDFALWKARKRDDEIAWESPWGMGRPGWHIECSAMALKHLGPTIDIHGGGEDLQFPHHENEIAQSECCNGVPFVHYWMHNGFITLDNVKMSKSRGNFFLVRDIRRDYSGEEIRFFLISGHYRGPINFSREMLEQSRAGLERIRNCAADLSFRAENGVELPLTEAEREILEDHDRYRVGFEEAMDDDLNTADAISAVFELVTDINTTLREETTRAYAAEALKCLKRLTGVLGLLEQDVKQGIDPEIQALIDERRQARKNRDFVRADQIRDELKARGITLKDTPQGVQVIKDQNV